MNNKQLILIMNTGSTLSGQRFTLDIDQTDEFNFNYVQSDIKNLAAKQNNYSKDTVLPATTNNHKAFSMIYDLQNITAYDQTQANTCLFTIDNTIYFTGSLQLVEILYDKSTLGNQIIKGYNVHLNGNRLQIFLQADAPISALTFSQFDHVFNYDNLFYYTNQKTGMTYCFVDYGNLSINTGQTNTSFFDQHYYLPCYYARYLWDAIFVQNSFQYESDFIENDELFNSLVIPANFDFSNVSGTTIITSAYTCDISYQSQNMQNADPVNTLYYFNTGDNDPTLIFQSITGTSTPIQNTVDLLGMGCTNTSQIEVKRQQVFTNSNFVQPQGWVELNCYGDGCLTIRKTGNYTFNLNMIFDYSKALQENGYFPDDFSLEINLYKIVQDANNMVVPEFWSGYTAFTPDSGGTTANDPKINPDYVNFLSFSLDQTNSGLTNVTGSVAQQVEHN